MKKSFWILWTYVANYSVLKKVQAKDRHEAFEIATFLYGKEFKNKAQVYVFDHPPALVKIKNVDCTAAVIETGEKESMGGDGS